MCHLCTLENSSTFLNAADWEWFSVRCFLFVFFFIPGAVEVKLTCSDAMIVTRLCLEAFPLTLLFGFNPRKHLVSCVWPLRGIFMWNHSASSLFNTRPEFNLWYHFTALASNADDQWWRVVYCSLLDLYTTLSNRNMKVTETSVTCGSFTSLGSSSSFKELKTHRRRRAFLILYIQYRKLYLSYCMALKHKSFHRSLLCKN